MKNLMKKLAVGALSLTFSLSGLKAQNELTRQDSIQLDNINRVPLIRNVKDSDIGLQDKEEYKWTQEPALYGGIVITATTLFNINYANNHLVFEDRKKMIKTTTAMYVVGIAASVSTYFIADRIIDNRKNHRKIEKKYLSY